MRSLMLISLLVGSLACPARLRAQEGNDSSFAPVLSGLSVVWVLVEDVDSVLVQAGLGRDQLLAHVAGRLRDAGIRIVGRSTGIRDRTPFVYLRLDGYQTEHGDYVFTVDLKVYENVRLTRDASITDVAMTWTAGGAFGTVAPQEVASLQEWVDEFVDSLVRSHHVTNNRAGS